MAINQIKVNNTTQDIITNQLMDIDSGGSATFRIHDDTESKARSISFFGSRYNAGGNEEYFIVRDNHEDSDLFARFGVYDKARCEINLSYGDSPHIDLFGEDNRGMKIYSTKIFSSSHLTLTAEAPTSAYTESRLEIHSGNDTTSPGYTKVILGGFKGTYGTQHPEFKFKDKGFLLNRDIYTASGSIDIDGDEDFVNLVLHTGAQTLNSTQKTQVLSNIGAAPIDHATSGDIYGKATTTKYGHVKLSNNTLNASSTGSSGIACGEGHKHSQYIEVSSWDATYGNLTIKINS